VGGDRPDEDATDGTGAPGLLSLNFLSFSVYAVRIAEKFWMHSINCR
jgi:hypothetical protein